MPVCYNSDLYLYFKGVQGGIFLEKGILCYIYILFPFWFTYIYIQVGSERYVPTELWTERLPLKCMPCPAGCLHQHIISILEKLINHLWKIDFLYTLLSVESHNASYGYVYTCSESKHLAKSISSEYILPSRSCFEFSKREKCWLLQLNCCITLRNSRQPKSFLLRCLNNMHL